MAGELPPVNPNALGAPAEGFGQTVSFAFDPKGEVPQMNPVTSRGPQVGVGPVRGAGKQDVNAAAREPIPVDPTAALLMKAGSDILNKKLDEARTEQFVTGMQRAMAGEGINEVKESVPWYAKIFGDTPVIEGARAYSAQDTVNKTIARETANLNKLAELDPDAAAKHFVGVMKGAQTGDSATDAIITKQMTEAMPALMKAQAKANYGFTQKRAASAMNASVASGADALQAYGEAHAGDMVDPKDMEVLGKQFVLSALPPAGIDEENWQKATTQNVLTMAQRGQFHAVEALRKSGIISALTPEQGTRVEKAVEAAATRHRDNYAAQYITDLSQIKSDAYHPPAGQTDTQLKERIDRANAAYQKKTGSPVGLWSSDQVADMMTGHYNAFKQTLEQTARAAATLSSQEAKAADKKAAADLIDTKVRATIADGEWDKAGLIEGSSRDQRERIIYELGTQQNPQAAAEFLRKGYVGGSISNLIADELQRGMKDAEASWARGDKAPPETFFKSVDAYNAMRQKGGSAFADAYFGDFAKPLAAASALLESSPDRLDAVYVSAMTFNERPSKELPAKQQEALVKAITSEGRDFTPTWLGGASLRPDAIRRLAGINAEKVTQWKKVGNLSDEEAVARALHETLGPKGESGREGGSSGEIIGGFFIERQPGSSTKRLTDLMSEKNLKEHGVEVPSDKRGKFFNEFLLDAVKLPSLDGTINIVRQPDAGGTAQFVVFAAQKDGTTILRNFTGDSLQTFAADKTKWGRLGFTGSSRAATPEENAAENADRARREATPVTPIPLTFGTAPQYDARSLTTANNPYINAATRARRQAEETRKLSTNR